MTASPADAGSTGAGAEHPSHPDQLVARALSVCWHSPTSDRWPCTVSSPEYPVEPQVCGASADFGPDLRCIRPAGHLPYHRADGGPEWSDRHATPPAVRTGEDDEADVKRVADLVSELLRGQAVGSERVRSDEARTMANRVAGPLVHLHRRVVSARPLVSGTAGPWRVGEHYGLHVYADQQPVATFHRPEDAVRAVGAVNGLVLGTANRDDVARWLSDRYGARVDPLDNFPGFWTRDADELLALLGGDQDKEDGAR